MKTRTLLLLGVLAAFASAATAEVRLKVEGGRRVIYNDGPAKLRASEDWLAARMQRPSGYRGADRVVGATSTRSIRSS